MTHWRISTGGAFDLVGKLNGYDVDEQVMSKPLVNPRIEVTEKNEKSTCNLWKGANIVLSTRLPLGVNVGFESLQIRHGQSYCGC